MSYKKKPTKEQINTLLNFYAESNQQYEQMIAKTKQLNTYKKMTNSKKFKEVSNNKPKKEFKNEVEFESINFWNFDEKPTFTGLIFGETKSIKGKDGLVECFIVVDEDEQQHLLPSNVQLTSKIKNLLKIKENELSMGVDIQIENLGLQKIDNVANKVKVFRVLTT